MLTQTGVVRSDIRSSLAGLRGTAVGVPLLIELTLVSASTCEVLADRFEVFPSLTAATNVRNKVATSQIALPRAASDLVHATSGYESSVRNLAGITLATDNVFSDGSALELATMMGSVSAGYKAALTVAVNGA